MTLRCPQCASIAPVPEGSVGADGRLVRCQACGTQWLARILESDPYARGTSVAPVAPSDDISEAIVIEHVGPGFARPASAARKTAPAAVPVRSPRDWRPIKIAAAIIGAIALVIVFRTPIMAALPGSLPEAVSMLEFESIHSETVHVRGARTLIVEGTIINRSAEDVPLPAVRVTLRSPGGEPVSSWLVEPSVTGLAPGRSIGFRSALAEPPPDATQVTLDLAAREGI